MYLNILYIVFLFFAIIYLANLDNLFALLLIYNLYFYIYMHICIVASFNSLQIGKLKKTNYLMRLSRIFSKRFCKTILNTISYIRNMSYSR